MTKPIYKVFLFRPTEAWYQLSDQEKNNLKKQLADALVQVNGKEIVTCFSGWNSEQYMGWGVEQFPNIEAVQKHHVLLENLSWFRYAESNSYLGTQIPKA